MPPLPTISQNNQQILADISTLQTMETDLFSSLETPGLTSAQKTQIVQKINQLSQMRVNLYQTLRGVNNFFQDALTSSHGTLDEQTTAIGIIEEELNQSQARLETLEKEKNNKIRLVEINEYYGDKYAEHANLMKIVIAVLIPIIILAILNTKGFLPNIIYYILVTIVSVIGAYYFWNRMFSIWTRDNMEYQTYDWGFDAKNAPKSSGVAGTDPWAALSGIGTCIGEACCTSATQTYDSTTNKCVEVESFVNNVLTKDSNTNKYKDRGNNLDFLEPYDEV